MKDRNASSYNLQDAKKILATLLPQKTEHPREEENRESHGYVRLAKKITPRPHRPSEAETAVAGGEPEAEERLSVPDKFTSWENCIAWCMQATRADAAFVVDSQGFIIAERGRVPAQGFECTGAELVYAMDQLERIDPEAGNLLWIDLDYDKRRVVGFVTPSEEGEYFIIGLTNPDSSYNAVKQTVSRQVIDSLQSMN
jgi:hypothetical protein